jgi:t-SNARE complex subunit (syntaxin)|tara:strand:+ start:255 stop:488 length:234 start_codon:yes stop_codon:yes gene_type:complete
MISLKQFLNEGIPNYFRGYFNNINNNLDRLDKNVKQLIKDLGKDGLKKESLEVASLYKKHIIEFKVKLKDFERKNRD